ncbi:electron transport complex subunit RsxG [Roseospirillum parvum]|uniref:Ion-translocating oxidoreductase complex subunit G n=1 Tax=Roseospirillum parvum TaxID=83401 RepID=A0A1G7ZWF1_9PROT|nr:electron transport complex subunit RsxG [Roseospirillum parvum]SDH12984.1 electron transport complex protein RnfG [Roseospirillum parvum]
MSAPYRSAPWFQAVLLGLFACLAAVLLAGGDEATREDIKARKAEDLVASLSQVIPPESHDNNLLADTLSVTTGDGDTRTVYQAIRAERVVAVAYMVVGQGYAGPVEVLMGVDESGTVLGARVLAHAETPGLGDKIERAKDDWIDSFAGQSFDTLPEGRWKVKKDGGVFDQFSGATITPRAVVQAVKGGLDFFHARRDELLTIPDAAPDPENQES